MTYKKAQHAIVIGGSITGLLIARVLSDYFDKVTILERDNLPQDPISRNGTPQDRHGHLLMARGQQILNDLIPEMIQDFEAANIPHIRWGLDTRVLMSGGWMAIADTGIRTYACSRLWLEATLRRHVLTCTNINLVERATVLHLLTDASKQSVTGVVYTSPDGEQHLAADFVADASGRRSQAPQWLEEMGCLPPSSTIIIPYMGYATRWYKKPEHSDVDWKLYISYARPEHGLYRSGAIVEVENDQWLVILGGTNKDYAPTDESEYVEFLKSLASPKIAEFLDKATPISPIYGYRTTENHWRHFEKLSRSPANFIVTGDAVCGFNPIYAQGMSLSALGAELLSQLLQAHQGDVGGNFAQIFQKELGKRIQSAWNLSAGADTQLPEATGSNPNWVITVAQHYITRLSRIMGDDPNITSTFLHVMHMLESPINLFKPQYIFKMLVHALKPAK